MTELRLDIKKLVAARQKAGLGLNEAARQAGINKSYLSLLENGHRGQSEKSFPFRTVLKLVALYKLESYLDLCVDEDENEGKPKRKRRKKICSSHKISVDAA